MRIPYVIENEHGQEKSYDLYSRLLKDRIIFIGTEFEPEMANSIVAQLLFLETVDSESDINIYINSPGGEVDSLYAIYDTMTYIKPDIVTIAFGTCASAANFILAAGTKGKRYALPNANLMMHEFSGGAQGMAHDLMNRVEHMKKLHARMAQHYSEFTGQDVEKIKEDMKKDYYMTPEEAKEYGLIDHIQYHRIDNKNGNDL